NFLQCAVTRDPHNPVILELTAARLISCHQYEAALPYCQRLIEGRPAAADRWFIFLTLYYHQTGQEGKVAQVLQQGLSVYPNHPRLRALQAYISPLAPPKPARARNPILEQTRAGF